jgi:hypothetical protein
MYAIKFLSDLIYAGIDHLIKDPFDKRIHPGLKHDLGEGYLFDLLPNFLRRGKSA